MKILIVEDEASIREVEKVFLEKAGCTVYEAVNGLDAVDMFHIYSPDLLLVDVNLPGLNGFEVCKRVRRESKVPIIIVTARQGDKDELEGFACGADDYIKKPFNPQVLVTRVRSLLHRHQGNILTFGALTVDPETMGVQIEGREVVLTTTQFNLLLALASHPNQVQTRTQLMSKAYNDPTTHDIYDRTIDAHIKAIRSLIEKDPSHPRYIRTVVGSGYVFKGEGGV